MTNEQFSQLLVAIPLILAALATFGNFIIGWRTGTKIDVLAPKIETTIVKQDESLEQGKVVIQETAKVHDLTNSTHEKQTEALRVATERIVGLEKLLSIALGKKGGDK